MATKTANLEGFIISDPKVVFRKIERIAKHGAHGLHFVFDFDYTLTVGKNATIWELLHSLLPEESQGISKATRKKYLAREAAGNLSVEDSHNWSITELDLHKAHGTNIRNLENAAKSIQLRSGAKDLFELCESRNIPTVVLSAGVTDIIELITHEHGIRPSLIVSSRLYLADDGRVIGYDDTNMVHNLNKQEKGDYEISFLRKSRPYTVLIGDTLGDAAMVKGKENVLRIRTYDTHKNESKSDIDAFRKASFTTGYDLIVEDDLDAVVDLVYWLTASR